METFKKIALTIIMIVFGFSVAKTQVAINPNGDAPDGSAMLDVVSTEKGMLIPRMTASEKNAIGSPATGLMIYQTDGTPGFYYNSGTPGSPDWQLVGTGAGYWGKSGTKTFLANNDDYVGIGTNNPASPLDVTKTITTTESIFVTHSKLDASVGSQAQTAVSAAIVGEIDVTNFTFTGEDGGVGAIFGMASGTTTVDRHAAGAFFSTVSGGTDSGSLGVIIQATGTAERNSGFVAEVHNGTLENVGGQLEVGGDNYESGVTNIGITSRVYNGRKNYGAQIYVDGDGVTGTIDTTYGIYASVRNGNINYAAQFEANGGTGSNDTTYGIYASARYASINYAAYFDDGTVYIKDRLELNSGVKNNLLSYNVGNPPSKSEINTATGTTPSTAGAGWTTYIRDTNDSNTIYQVISDGTDWHIFTSTKAQNK